MKDNGKMVKSKVLAISASISKAYTKALFYKI
jgi:hypothetical protein